MGKKTTSEDLRLSTGGLFYRLAVQVKILDPSHNCVWRRIWILLTVTLLPLVVLALFEGNLVNPDLSVALSNDPQVFARFLVAMPMLIVACALIDPMVAMSIQSIGLLGFVEPSGTDRFKASVEALRRQKDSSIADLVIFGLVLVATVTLAMAMKADSMLPAVANRNWTTRLDGAPTRAGLWAVMVSMPILQILIARWFWRFLLWVRFLYRVSRLELQLEPSHPDLSGGLGFLKFGQSSFVILFLAVGTMVSGLLAQEIFISITTFQEVKVFVAGFAAICFVFLVSPLFLFTRQLVVSKRNGWAVYSALGHELSLAFAEKRIGETDLAAGKSLMESGDASTVCDYGTVFDVVRSMRVFPIDLKSLGVLAVALLIPFVPLALMGVPFVDFLKRLLQALS